MEAPRKRREKCSGQCSGKYRGRAALQGRV